jgi:hypothetical protein
MLERILQIVGDIGRRLAAAPEIDAPSVGAAGDRDPVRSQFVDDRHEEGGDLFIGHGTGLRRNRGGRQPVPDAR